jgi:hypothetical protein
MRTSYQYRLKPTREQAKKIMRQWYDEDVASGKYEGLK